MERQDEPSSRGANQRWICEACGCNTNNSDANPTTCSICGSSRQSSISDLMMRRDDGSASSQLLRRSFFLRRRGIDFPRHLNPRQFLRGNAEPDDVLDDPSQAVAALAMEVAGVADPSLMPGIQRRRDYMLRSQGLGGNSQQLTEEELLQQARENSTAYDPQWATHADLGFDDNTEYDIKVSTESFANVAMLPVGVSEGKAVRARDPIPQEAALAPGGAPQAQPKKPVVGFRVCFSRPFREKGKNMGGGYLVGVVSSSFLGFSERNGLQSSQYFWGIDDSGNKYEGPFSGQSSRGSRRLGPFRGMEIDARGSRRSERVLFGSRDVITVVYNGESRTLSFWRDDVALGTLVYGLRAGTFFPVAVPFNCGVNVAITGMNGDPISVLKSFAAAKKLEQLSEQENRRMQLHSQFSELIDNGIPTDRLTLCLRSIFILYREDDTASSIDETAASRLWYRCGIQLSNLEQLLEDKSPVTSVDFEDFLQVITDLVQEEASHGTSGAMPSSSLDQDSEGNSFHPFVERCLVQVGDVVELIPGFEKYGDAAGGPMAAGDRGQVVEIQNGPYGEPQSIRVLYNGRRWWYQPQTLLSEKSGLIELPIIWFIRRILRVHGYDETKLEPLWGKPVEKSSWNVGDLVVPKFLKAGVFNEANNLAKVQVTHVGRIASPSDVSSQNAFCRLAEDEVFVESMDRKFLELVGVEGCEDTRESIHKVKFDRLIHAGIIWHTGSGTSNMTTSPVTKPSANEDVAHDSPQDESHFTRASKSDVAAVGRLDIDAIERVSKECQKGNVILAQALTSGLPEAILAGLDRACDHCGKPKEEERLFPSLAALGSLCVVIARGLYGTSNTSAVRSDLPNDSSMLDQGSAVSEMELAPGSRERSVRDNVLSSLMSGARLNESTNLGSAFYRSGNTLLQPLGMLRDNAELASLLYRQRTDLADRDTWGSLARILNNPSAAALPRQEGRSDPMVLPEGGSLQPAQADRERSSESLSTHQVSQVHLIRRGAALRSRRKTATATSSDIRSAVMNGLLANDLNWFGRVLETTRKRKGGSYATIANASDDDNMPLLLLAVQLGCSRDIVGAIIHGGGAVCQKCIAVAAYTGQCDVLSLLLEHHSCVDGLLDAASCSTEVLRVLEKARQNHRDQEQTLRSEGEKFLSMALDKLLDVALFCLRRSSSQSLCHRAVSQALVGRVLLKAMHNNRIEKMRVSQNLALQASVLDGDNESGRVPLFLKTTNQSHQNNPSAVAADEGLAFLVSSAFLSRLIGSSSTMSGAKFTQLMEALLWSRDVEDVALGLTMAIVLLQALPPSERENLIRRYGVAYLVGHHSKYSQQVLHSLKATIESRQRDGPGVLASFGVVLCPKQHSAELHVTKHSSFRCDLCGKGVERGYPMHGCRECDWDACELCINKREGGIVKWGHVQSLAVECIRLMDSLSTSPPAPVSVPESTLKLLQVARRVRNFDSSVLSDLKTDLYTPGGLTLFEFTSLILPALHEALVSSSQLESSSLSVEDSSDILNRKKKKQRTSRGSPDGLVENFLRPNFQHLTARHLVVEAMKELQPSKENLPPERTSGDATDHDANDDFEFMDLGADESGERGKHRQVCPEFVRRIHVALALHLQQPNPPNAGLTSNSSKDLQALTRPITLELVVSKFARNCSTVPFHLHVEPLLSVSALSMQIIRGVQVASQSYKDFCIRLCEDEAIIVERPIVSGKVETESWRIARVISFHEATCSHVLRYASSVVSVFQGKILDIRGNKGKLEDMIEFLGEERCVMLAARELRVIHRKGVGLGSSGKFHLNQQLSPLSMQAGRIPPGTRVESRSAPADAWKVYTVHRSYVDCASRPGWNGFADGRIMYHLVADDGCVVSNIEAKDVRLPDGDSVHSRSVGDFSEGARPTNRLAGLRRLVVNDADEPRRSLSSKIGVLKRSWSGLSPVETSAPMNLEIGKRSTRRQEQSEATWHCLVGETEVVIVCDAWTAETVPRFEVRYSGNEYRPTMNVPSDKTTVFSLIRWLHEAEGEQDVTLLRANSDTKLYYSIEESSPQYDVGNTSALGVSSALEDRSYGLNQFEPEQRRDVVLSASQPFASKPIAWGLDLLSIQCLEVLDSLSASARESYDFHGNRGDERRSSTEQSVSDSFESESLTAALTQQLDDSLAVVGGALPKWCYVAPSIAPSLFSYSCRRLLLDRTAFGLSRSTLKQQEAKVNVGPLRKRMAALRSRAVELVGEAFSGGAEDPTALQLQADELYGMEEALGARVAAAFRAQRWQELSLDCVRAAVRRDRLLSDAAEVMDSYANDAQARHRRLEIRFQGESGFDAASGSEAGVTRGFYADVAEALMTADHVTGVTCAPTCDLLKPASLDDESQHEDNTLKADFSFHETKLPLWIPDMDASCTVTIPTPRASRRSSPGLFPRPLAANHPQLECVKAQFRFMGRMFAAAFRDGFMFPLPLSCSFLKLVQSIGDPAQEPMSLQVAKGTPNLNGNQEDTLGGGENNPHVQVAGMNRSPSWCTGPAASCRKVLTSEDLPRPGFVGGEVYAVENFICASLDALESKNLTQDQLDNEMRELAADRSFASKALGKAYECSFSEYFEGRTFVDPLDPTQGQQAHALSANGHLRPVTIHNVREWVELSKDFLLHDGILEQAAAFCRGINDFYCAKHLSLFTTQELQRDVCGSGDAVSAWTETDIRKLFKLEADKTDSEGMDSSGDGSASLGRRFSSSSATIQFLVKTLLKSSVTQRRQFLSFVTSVPIATPGKIEVVPILAANGELLPVGDNCLPRANTCARKLYLPKFENFESFSSVLWAVLREESRFKGFYEWRGN